MWHMLCDAVRAKGQAVWRFEARDVQAEGDHGSAHWEARYRFGNAGRRVHNIVDAQFTFEGGLIATHRDIYSFWRWSRQALGPAGAALGWTQSLRQKVRQQADAKLQRHLARRAAAHAVR
jgi:hypothetical protein